MTAMAQFKPSKASLTPKKKALLSLGYARAAVEALEKHLKDSEDEAIPVWVLTKINQGATCLGQAVSFVSFTVAKKKKEKA